MTTFEITIIVLLAAIVVLLGFIAFCVWNHYRDAELSNYMLRKKLDNIDTNTATSVGVGIDLKDIVDKMHRNLCVEIADKMVNKMYPVNEGESLDAPFVLDYKLKKDIENKLNGFAAAVLDAECCPQEILDLWAERICKSAHKFIKQFKIDWDKLSKEQQDEFLKRLIMPNYDSPFQPPFNPTCETTNNNE